MRRSLLMIIFFPNLLFDAGARGKRIMSYAGSYKAYGEKCTQCPENKITDKVRIYMRLFHLSHVKALQLVTANITNIVPYNDTFWLQVKLDIWNNNQWKENAFLFKFPSGACNSLRSNIPDFFAKLFQQNPYSKEPCRVDAGTHQIDRQPINWTFPNFPVMPYGLYRFTLTLGVKKEQYGCTSLECKIVPLL